MPGELAVGRCGGKHAENHRHLGANHRTRASGEKGFHRGNPARQVTGIVSHVRAESDLPGRRERHRQQEAAPAEVPDLQKSANVGLAHQAVEQVNERNDPDDAGHPADEVDHPITEHRYQHDDAGENEDTDAVADPEQLAQRLPGKHRSGRGETKVHQAHQYDRNGRAINAELYPAGNHLRQAQLRPLCRMQRHHPATDQLADQQTDQRPEHIAAQHHGQSTGDNRGDLQVGAQPQGELAQQTTVSFRFRDIVDRTRFDQRFAACTIVVNSHDSTSVDCYFWVNQPL